MSNNNELRNKKFYKILPENLTCHGFKYQLGLNIDTYEFDNKLCQNGLHFSDAEHVLIFVDLYNSHALQIAEVEIPEGEEVIYDIGGRSAIYKSHSIIIKSIRPLRTINTIKWMTDNEIYLKDPIFINHLLRNNTIDIIEYMIKYLEYDIHIFNLNRAVIYNKIDMVRLLIDYGANINGYSNLIYNAICSDNIELLNLLIERGLEINNERIKFYSSICCWSNISDEMKSYIESIAGEHIIPQQINIL